MHPSTCSCVRLNGNATSATAPHPCLSTFSFLCVLHHSCMEAGRTVYMRLEDPTSLLICTAVHSAGAAQKLHNCSMCSAAVLQRVALLFSQSWKLLVRIENLFSFSQYRVSFIPLKRKTRGIVSVYLLSHGTPACVPSVQVQCTRHVT